MTVTVSPPIRATPGVSASTTATVCMPVPEPEKLASVSVAPPMAVTWNWPLLPDTVTDWPTANPALVQATPSARAMVPAPSVIDPVTDRYWLPPPWTTVRSPWTPTGVPPAWSVPLIVRWSLPSPSRTSRTSIVLVEPSCENCPFVKTIVP